MTRIIELNRCPESLTARVRVAAYARVSVDSDMLLHSLSSQVDYYKNKINSNSGWEYAGIYVDKGITGTRTDLRKGFMNLMCDCEKGLINLVLVKSISRFARNTLDCIKAIRHLKDLGIAVFFERENINSMTSDGEFMLTLLASFAQEESRSISQNVKWRIKKRFELGEQNGFKAPYGYRWDGEMYRIVSAQGAVVKEIYRRYLAGDSAYGIAKEMAARGIKGNAGAPIEQTTVKLILSNVAYTGNKMLQKYFIDEAHRRRTNRGELPRYLVEGLYEPLVSEEDFMRAQAIRKERAEESAKPIERSPFSSKLKCGYCGHGISHRKFHKKWVCNTKERKGKAACDLRDVSDAELKSAASKALKSGETANNIRKVLVFGDHFDFLMSKGLPRTVRRKLSGDRGQNVFTKKVFCGICGHQCRRANWSRGVKYWVCENCHKTKIPEAELLKAADTSWEENPEGQIVEQVQRIDVFINEVRFILKDEEERVCQRV